MLPINTLKKEIPELINFKEHTFEPYNKMALNFLLEFSEKLKENKLIYKYPDLFHLIFWTKHKFNQLYNIKKNNLKLGRGIIFHLCPSNVPTNFIYSFFFGLIRGNSNIVKIPSKNFKQKEIILNTLKNLFKKKKFRMFKNSNIFIQYDDKLLTEKISSICDGRLIWGGDKKINEVSKIWTPERSIDLKFADRYSFSIFDVKKMKSLSKLDLLKIIKKFYIDSYSFGQAACNSPHFIFWIGKNDKILKNKFWSLLNKTVSLKEFNNKDMFNKYAKLLEDIVYNKNFMKINKFSNKIYVINVKKKVKNIENIRGINGTFYQLNCPNLNSLNNYITKKCQTVSYYGFKKNHLEIFIKKNKPIGIDRIVPIGKSLDIDFYWDGYNCIEELSRYIRIE